MGFLRSVSVFTLAVVLVLMEAVVHPGAILAAATGGERRMALFNNAEAVLNLGLSIVFVIRFGVVGVIGATILAQALTNLWFLPVWAMRSLAISVREYATATFVRTAIPAACGVVAGLLVVRMEEGLPGVEFGRAEVAGHHGSVYPPDICSYKHHADILRAAKIVERRTLER